MLNFVLERGTFPGKPFNMDNYQALQQFIGQFFPLNEEEFAQLKKRSSVVHVRKKDIITSAGETENYLYYVPGA